MQPLSKPKLIAILNSELSLTKPVFDLETIGNRISGSVISESFRGKRDSERQRAIWDVLDEKLGADSVKLVGMLLAYTPDEWEAGSSQPPRRAAKTA